MSAKVARAAGYVDGVRYQALCFDCRPRYESRYVMSRVAAEKRADAHNARYHAHERMSALPEEK